MRHFAICEGSYVRILSKPVIVAASIAHPEWAASLASWYAITKAADWKNVADLRLRFNSADGVGKCIVFNIAHNRYRLIVWIKFEKRKVFIRHILTQREYDKGGWENDCK
jgi:mRNA interferase HigB